MSVIGVAPELGPTSGNCRLHGFGEQGVVVIGWGSWSGTAGTVPVMREEQS